MSVHDTFRVKLTLSTLGKNSADDICNYFSHFARKQALTFHANRLIGDNLHGMSKPIF